MVRRRKPDLAKDVTIICASIIFAILIAKSGAVEQLLGLTRDIGILGSFITGIFFTSILTLAPATVVLGEIAQTTPLLQVALYGATGAVIGDLLIFFFIRDGISDDVTSFFKSTRFSRFFFLFRHKRMKWISPVVGALIIASPLPDELGIALMGFSKVKTALLIPISFVMNALGIVLVGLVARSLL
jgi:hypothetical protein